MYNMIVGQFYFDKNKNGEFEGTKGLSRIFSEYSKKVYNNINTILLGCPIDKDLNDLNSFIISEATFSIISSNENFNKGDAIYISLEELLENDELCNSLVDFSLQFNSEVNLNILPKEFIDILNIFQKTIRNDIVNILKNEKNIELKSINKE